MSEATASSGPTGTTDPTNATTSGAFSLENILSENHEAVEELGSVPRESATGWDEEEAEKPLVDGYCVECEGEPFKKIHFFLTI